MGFKRAFNGTERPSVTLRADVGFQRASKLCPEVQLGKASDRPRNLQQIFWPKDNLEMNSPNHKSFKLQHAFNGFPLGA